MKFGQIPEIDKPVSRLAQGTMPLSSSRLDESLALLDGVFELGCNTFDTAHIYGGGDCERVFGRWVKDRGIREKVVILAKGAHHNQDRKRVTPFDISADLHDSLARMQTDYVDMYVLHRDDLDVPAGEIVEWLNEHIRAGRVRAIGGSNWSHERIREANEYAQQNGLVPLEISSPNLSLAVQRKEPWAGCVSISGNQAAQTYYRDSRLALFLWSSLAGGFFSGRIRRDNTETFTDYFGKLAVECYATEENFQRLDRCEELAQRKGVATTQIALAWVLAQPMNAFPLVGCANAEEFRMNAAALDIELTQQEARWLLTGE